MGPGTGRSGVPRATPADTLRALAGDISDYLASRGELLQGIAADPAYAPRAASGREALAQIINRTPEEGRARFDEVFANPFMGAMPVAGIFAGMGAKTADLAKLRVAEDMAGKGAEPEAIRAATGWFQGPDQKWRFEIPDNEAFLETPRGAPPGYEALQHPDVQDAYPDLWAQLQQSIRPGPQRGKFYPDTKTIVAEGPTQDVRRSTALHEIQHAVQQREGFAPGASVGGIEAGMDNARRRVEETTQALNRSPAMQRFRDDFASKFGQPYPYPLTDAGMDEAVAKMLGNRFGVPSEEVSAFLASHPMLQSLRQDLTDATAGARQVPGYGTGAYNAYRNVSGEVEARDVQSRADFTPEQRAATTPYSSQGIAPDDMIVLPRSGGVQASVRGVTIPPDDLARLRGMTEDEYVAAINPDGKRIPDRPFGPQRPEPIRELMVGLGEPPRLVRTDTLADGSKVKIVAVTRYGKPTGEYWAVQGKNVIGQAAPTGDGTALMVADEFQGKGIGTLLSSVARAADPFAPSGGLSAGGEATARKAFQNIVAPEDR